MINQTNQTGWAAKLEQLETHPNLKQLKTISNQLGWTDQIQWTVQNATKAQEYDHVSTMSLQCAHRGVRVLEIPDS